MPEVCPGLLDSARFTAQPVTLQLQPLPPGQAGPSLQHLHGGDRPALAAPSHLPWGGNQARPPGGGLELGGQRGGGVGELDWGHQPVSVGGDCAQSPGDHLHSTKHNLTQFSLRASQT